jgi:ABC-type uncharacterized transport system permease subunit
MTACVLFGLVYGCDVVWIVMLCIDFIHPIKDVMFECVDFVISVVLVILFSVKKINPG